eukprot:GSChrysophyteH2.ASY1.ANO1.1210.1 assembled CDS
MSATSGVYRTKNASNHIMMIRPAKFGMNVETAIDNFYQDQNSAIDVVIQQELALKEFSVFVQVLLDHGIKVHVLPDTLEPETPDAIFPNNWVSLHSSGHILYYPMKAENRRWERRADLPAILSEWGFRVDPQLIEDHSHHENGSNLSSSGEGLFLEGTGSLIFDHDAKIAYCARSPRASAHLVGHIVSPLGYRPVVFSAFLDRMPIYHTNVMMTMTDAYAVVCLAAIDDPAERDAVCTAITESGKEILEITEAQKHQFAGNMLLVKGSDGPSIKDKLYLVMSASAHAALTAENIAFITSHGHEILSVPIPTIERLGGGSARCMMAEIYLERS